MPFPVDLKFVTEAERKLGVKFPASFVLRMVRSNGGEVATPPDSWVLFPFLDTSDRKRLKRTCNDIVLETRKAREWRGFPGKGVAIGAAQRRKTQQYGHSRRLGGGGDISH